MFSRTCAWTSTPGMRGSTGVVFELRRPTADVPISTSRCATRSAGTRPSKHVDRRYVAALSCGAKWIQSCPLRSVGITKPGTAALCTPAWSERMRTVLLPLATRNISSVSDGMIAPCACITTGTRLTIPSRSGRIVKSPRPLAACSRTGTLRSRPGKLSRKGRASPPMVAMPIGGWAPPGSATAKGRPDLPTTTRDLRKASASIASLLGSERSFVRVASSRSRNVSAATPGDIRSGSAKTTSNATTSAPI